MTPDLATTNLLLGIMAAVSVLEALVIIGAGIAGWMAYRRVMTLVERGSVLVEGIEARQVAPAMLRVNAILDDVKDVTASLHSTVDRIDDTAVRVRTNVRAKTSAVVGVIRGARLALEHMLRSEVRT